MPERSGLYPVIMPLSDCKYTFANASVIVQKQFGLFTKGWLQNVNGSGYPTSAFKAAARFVPFKHLWV